MSDAPAPRAPEQPTPPESAVRRALARARDGKTLDQGEAATLMHARGDLRVPFELGQHMSAGIPNAKFVALQSRNHLLLENEPAAERFFEEIRIFLGN